MQPKRSTIILSVLIRGASKLGRFTGVQCSVVVAMLRVHFISSRPSSDHPRVLHLDSLRKEYVRRFVVGISNRFAAFDIDGNYNIIGYVKCLMQSRSPVVTEFYLTGNP